MTKFEVIDRAHNAATGRWVDADWCHEYRRIGDEYPVRDEHGEFALCAGNYDDCAVCAEALDDAAAAEDAAQAAVDAARVGDYDAAMIAAQQAADLESTYGDNPVWGPFAAVIEEMQS